MENLSSTSRSGLGRNGLRLWGLLFLLAGMVGRSIFQMKLLGIGQISGGDLLTLMQNSDDAMIFATVALILQAVETCATPIFAFLLIDGFRRTSNFRNYLLKIAGVAVISEIPFNLAVSGKVLDTSSRNPVVGMVFGLVMLYLFRYFSEDSVRQRIIKLLVGIAGILWATMLRVDNGIPLMVMICILWAFRKNPLTRNIAGATAAVVCTLVSPFYLASPMAMLVVHFYNEEKEYRRSQVVVYLAYPVMVLAVALAAMFAF